MVSEAPIIDWEDILDRFSSYEGTIKAFCKENNIKAHQLYYRRKRLENQETPIFHAVSIKEKISNKVINETDIPSSSQPDSTIKIELGKAKIIISSHDTISLTNILKVIMKSC